MRSWVQRYPRFFWEGRFTSQDVTQSYWLEFDGENKVKRVILCVYHPEALYASKQCYAKVKMDVQYNLVGALANMGLDLTYSQRGFSTEARDAGKDPNVLESVISHVRAERESGADNASH